MREFFTPLRVLTVVGLGLLLVLWCGSLLGMMWNTRLAKDSRDSFRAQGLRR